MQILFLADNFPPEKNAQASRVFERACYWVRWGHKVTVITCAPNFPEGKLYSGYKNRWYQSEEHDGIRVIRVKTFIAPNAGTTLRIADFLSFMFSALCVGLALNRPAVVIATSPQFFAAVAGWALAKIKGVPFVFELSDLWPDSIVAVGAMRPNIGLKLLERFELFLYHQCAAVIALTHAFKRNLIGRGIAPDKIHVVLNGVELSIFKHCPREELLAEELGLNPTECIVGYIGTLGMAHDLNNVLNAAELMKNEAIRFLLVGPGAERSKLIDEVSRRKLRNVLIVPPQSKDRMPAFWSICDVALVHLKNTPLFQTVIPSKIFEAMAMGKAIILAAPKGEASRIVEDAGAGLCIPAGNPDGLADAVRILSRDHRLRDRLARYSAQAAPTYSRERQAREMIEIISAVVTTA